MARLRRPAPVVNTAGVPVELLDPLARAWATPRGTWAWLAGAGLSVAPLTPMIDRKARHRTAAGAWAIAAGLTGRRPGFPDWQALRDLGVRFDHPDDADPRAVLYQD